MCGLKNRIGKNQGTNHEIMNGDWMNLMNPGEFEKAGEAHDIG
jgi:hypothetical protein